MYKSTIAFLSVYGTKDFILHFAANFTLDSHFSYFLQDFCQIHKDSKDTVLILTVFNPLARWESCLKRWEPCLKDKTPVMWKGGNLPLTNTITWFF